MRRWILMAVLCAACGGDGKKAGETDAECGGVERCAADVGNAPGEDAGSGETDMPTSEPDEGTPSSDAGPDSALPDMAAPGCGRTPAPADSARKVVVARPFEGTIYEVLDLDAAGNLTRPGVTFDMGAAFEGEIQFTPDGEVGYSVQENGNLGVFRFSADGTPEVLSPAFDPGFYITGALIDPSGDVLWGWQTGWRGDAGGALYRMELDCASGMPSAGELFSEAKLVRGAAFLDATTLALAAVDVLDDETPNDVHLVDVSKPAILGSTPAFPDMDAIAAGFALTRDGRYALIGDNSAFSGVPNRLGIVRIDGDALTHVGNFDIGDPVTIVTSPFDNAAIVLSTTADDINVLSYDPGNMAAPFTLEGPLTTTDATLLPLSASMIDRGSLEGLVIIGENVGVRRVRFEASGAVTDLGLLELGNITGAIGVQP